MDIEGDRVLDTLDDIVNIHKIKTASNAAFRIEILSGEAFIYKPVSGERPLWDFQAGTLLNRELLSAIFFDEMDIPIPRTRLLQNGPYGIGLLQDWITPADSDFFKILPADLEVAGWLKSFRGYDHNDLEVVLWHQANDLIRSIVFGDLVINNADRKGSHLLKSSDLIYPIDHGLTFHHEPKLRTIFWGWAGEAFKPTELSKLRSIENLVGAPWMTDLISGIEIEALLDRVQKIISFGGFPAPPLDRAALPWPIY
jgi:uncharacterized repeat protein (TIGR03843 family)